MAVATKDYSTLGGRKIQPDSIPEFGKKVRIVGCLERASEVRLDLVAVPHSAPGMLGNSYSLAHATQQSGVKVHYGQLREE